MTWELAAFVILCALIFCGALGWNCRKRDMEKDARQALSNVFD